MIKAFGLLRVHELRDGRTVSMRHTLTQPRERMLIAGRPPMNRGIQNETQLCAPTCLAQ